MSEFPYETRLNVLHGPLDVIDAQQIADECTYKWFNQTLCQVNHSVVRIGVIEGEYHWHKHDHDDEFFYVVAGALDVDLQDRTFTLRPRQGIVVPRGCVHRTRASGRTVSRVARSSIALVRSNWQRARLGRRGGQGHVESVLSSDDRFVVASDDVPTPPITLILNWRDRSRP